MTFKDDLSWGVHVNEVCRKVKSKLYLFSRIKVFLPRPARKQFFNSFILPHFDYCLSVWDDCGVKEMKRLDRLMKKSMRLILNINTSVPVEDMYQELHWFPLSYRSNAINCTNDFIMQEIGHCRGGQVNIFMGYWNIIE